MLLDPAPVLRAKKHIFCVNPGRSGSYFLSQVFNHIPGVVSTHEPEHQFSKYAGLRPHLWELKTNPLANTFIDRRQLKLWQINDLTKIAKAETYIETNPLFCTLWQDVIFADHSAKNTEFKIIILKRSMAKVLKSILDMGWFTNRSGHQWMTSAYSVNSLFNPPMAEINASPMENIIGYLVNVELNAQKIICLCRQQGIEVIHLPSESLFNNFDAVNELILRCDLDIKQDNLKKLLNFKHNKPSVRKNQTPFPIEDCLAGIDNYLSKCQNLPFNSAGGGSLFF